MTIEQIQELLAFLGYYTLRRKNGTIAIDGIAGPSMAQAIRNFQEDFTLPQTGECDEATQQALRHAVAYGMPVIDPEEEETAPADPPAEHASVWDEPDVKPYFSKAEFACPCPRCGGFPVEPADLLVRCCAAVRKEANRRKPGTVFKISSGVRCQAHNDELPGSVPDSRHVRGRAVDFTLPGFSPQEILWMAKETPGIVYAYIMPSGWVHMDIGN